MSMEKAIKLITLATEEDNGGQYLDALLHYQEGIDYLLHVLKYEAHGPRAKETARNKIHGYLERAEQIKQWLVKKGVVPAGGPITPATIEAYKKTSTGAGMGGRGGAGGGESGGAMGGGAERRGSGGAVGGGRGRAPAGQDNSSADRDKKFAGAILVEKPSTHWDDIAGMTMVKEELKDSLWNMHKSQGVLLYGPGGTGKTLLAKAAAAETNLTMVSISAPYMASKSSLEGRGLINSLFESARRNRPALILIEAMDAVSSVPPDSAAALTEFITQTQCAEKNSNILIIGATDAPWKIDTSVRKLFNKQLCTSLPELSARKRLFETHVGKTPTSLTSGDLHILSTKTEGYSGADIGRVVQEALMMPLRKVQSATHFKTVRGPLPFDPTLIVDDLWMPCSPRDPGAREMSWMDVPGDKLLEPRVTLSDFLKSLQSTPASISADDLKQYEEFKLHNGY